MISCTFELNSKPMSALVSGAMAFPAFAGLGAHANRREFACHVNVGPIPPGDYYIFDRQSGGLLGPLRDIFTGRGDWFALYADDGRIDDETLCNAIKRGSFRLHPKGGLGRSEGCVVIDSQADFQRFRAILKGSKQVDVPGARIKAYGKLTVK